MVLVGAVRVVPSGKVYRQVFDDEVHLVRSLEEVRNKAEQHKFPMNSGRIPVVRDLGMCAGKGLLSHRQQKWVEGMLNDDFTENPVLYREMTFRKAQESEDVIAAREVRGLSDFIIPQKTNSNIIERLSERRRGRHNEAVAVLEQELACIGREMEPFILESGELLLTKLSESDKAIELLFKKIESDTDLEAFSFTSFGELWDAISQESLCRRQRIKEMDETLIKLEVARAEKIKDLLRKYTKILKDISYFSPSDVHRFIHTEAMMINQALLANQRAIAKLFVNLMEADLKRELSQWLKWQERLKDWKIMQKDYVIRSFREFMARKEVQEPTAVKRDLENMIKDQISLSRKRMELLQVLCDLLPPTHSKAEINEWYESLVALNKYIDTHNVQHMMIIRIQYERVCQECLANVQLCKNKLLSLKVCTEKEAEKVVNPDFFKMVGRLQSRFEQELEQMDRDFEDLAKHIEQDCKDLYKYFQQAIVLWDEHQLKLSQQENELQVKLNECRRKHENLNQIREANLDIILDKLRTQSSERKLKNLLGKAFASLDVIRAGYEAFHQDLVKIVASYPEAILKELISYSSSIGQYFGVKEVYKQVGSAFEEQVFVEDSEVENMAETTGDSLLQETEETEQQSESFPQGSTEAEQQTESLTNKTEETNTVENEESSVQETEEAEKPGDGESTAPESEETEHLEVSAESEANRFEDGDSPAQAYEEMDYLKDILPESEVLFHDSGEAESCEVIAEVFTTSSGNTYSVLGRKETGKTKTSEIYYAEFAEKTRPVYLENVLVPDSLFTELKKRIRLCFFEHLEKWFVQSLSNSWIIVTAKKEELDSELQLRLHMHQPRRERIEKDIHNVRAAELLLHQERLESHCAGVVEALNKEKNEFMKLQEDQNDISKNFRRRIQDMEAIFLSSTKAEKLVALSNSLHSELLNHVEVIQISLRSYRNYLEEALGKLRDSNVDFLKACRLFSEGGNFSPEEVEFFCKRLEKETGRIDFIEGLIMIDMEKMESNYLEQATEVINKFETKFHNLAMDRLFMEKIQRFLTNLQVKIKSEVANSNLQAQTLNSSLEKFLKKIDACAHPTVDKEAVTSEELYDFAKTVMKELKKRSKYLNCLLDPIQAQTEFALRGSIAAAVRTESLKEESRMVVMGLDNVPLLNPSRIGKSVIDDVAVSVIKNLLQIQQPKKSPELRHERDDRSQSVAGAIYQPMCQPIYQPIYQATYQVPTAQRGSVSNLKAESPKNSVPYGNLSVGPKISASVSKKFSVGSIQKYSRSGRIDKKFHIFGEKPKESDHFKGIITCILWEGNDTLLCLAEEFYRKDKHQITRPEYLQETFDHCAELFGQKLLSYQSQTDDYHNSCLIEFWDQLKLFEEQLPHVSHLVIDSLLKEHEQQFRHSTDQIRQLFKEQLEEWDNAKAENKNKLRPALGHPDNLPQLEVLCQEELKRQKDQADGILLNTQTLQACAAECAQNFVSALASLTENLLLELDESITIDDIQVARIEMPKEKISTLIRRKRAGLSLEIRDVKPLTERGSRTWPGIPKTTLTDVPDHILCRETASVTTAKTTLGHVSAEEARDAAYVKYKHKLEEEFAKIKEENTAQLMKAQRWEGWWKQSVQKIKQLYA